MKTINLQYIFKLSLLVSILVLTSCNKEEIAPVAEAEEVPTIPANSFFAKVDGDEFVQWLADAYVHTPTNSINIVTSESGAYPSIGLNVPKSISPGGYAFSAGLGTFGLYSLGTGDNDLYGAAEGTGVLVISEHDKVAGYIKGTFYFTASALPGNTNTNSFVISEGTFAFNYN
ncbi:MAG: hypothetical protein ACI837_003579 [Crocinitomicaceae bacterium]|jgi:hypothetical protein